MAYGALSQAWMRRGRCRHAVAAVGLAAAALVVESGGAGSAARPGDGLDAARCVALPLAAVGLVLLRDPAWRLQALLALAGASCRSGPLLYRLAFQPLAEAHAC